MALCFFSYGVGQIAANKLGRWHGSTDTPLTLRGRWQAYLTGRHLSQKENLAAVYTSPLDRCRHTGALAAPRLRQATKSSMALRRCPLATGKTCALST